MFSTVLSVVIFSNPVMATTNACKDPDLASALSVVNQKLQYATNHEQNLKRTIKAMEKSHRFAKVEAYSRTAITAVSAAYLLTLGAWAAVTSETVIVVTASSLKSFLSPWFAFPVAAVLGFGTPTAGFLTGIGGVPSLVHDAAASEFDKIKKQEDGVLAHLRQQDLPTLSTQDLASKSIAFMQLFTQAHDEIAEFARDQLSNFPNRRWTLGWDDLMYVEAQLKEMETQRIVYAEEADKAAALSRSLRAVCYAAAQVEDK